MIHGRLVLRALVVLLLVVALFMAVPLLWVWIDNEVGTARAFIIPIAVTIAIAAPLLLVRRFEFEDMSPRDGFLLVAVSWLGASALGAVPFVLSGAVPSYIDALFETMSGFTTTGASILRDIEALPRSLLFWRSLTHWLGGMGIIVLVVAVFPLLGVGGFQLLKAEAPGPTTDKLLPRATQTAKVLWLTYVGFSAAQTLLLVIGGLSLFDALTHTFGTVATGGFSPYAASVGHFGSSYVEVVVTIFMVLAGVNFVLYFKALTGDVRALFSDPELRAYLLIFGATSIVAAIVLLPSVDGFGAALRYGSFQVASILTTTGYATADFAIWPTGAQTLLFALMFIGGSSGSTGGGIKVIRVLTVFKQGWNEMRYLVYPRGVFGLRVGRDRVRKDVVYAISGFVALYFTLIVAITVVLGIGGQDIVTALTSALATLGNIGPGFGRVGPVESYAFYSAPAKLLLTAAMMLGRLEIYTVLVLFTRRYWLQD